ncbi:MAG: hypothetical protein JXA11_06605 [Phycisphaerae bacterium]|nr:hypothetical protein [Phycisphaerae bacterium]
MMKYQKQLICIFAVLICIHTAQAGPYSPGKGGPAENGYIDAGIAGFVGPEGLGVCDPDDPGSCDNYVNPYFAGWAATVDDYSPSDNLGPYAPNSIGRPPYYAYDFGDPQKATGAVTGDNFNIVSLGDRDAAEILSNPAGSLTLSFTKSIINGSGADFAVFENCFVSQYTTGQGSTYGEMLAEFAFVEVSTNGTDFARFPNSYLNYPDGGTGGDLDGDSNPENITYLTQDVSNVYNLAGKHQNASGESWGTPFNLDELAEDPLVTGGTVNLNNINYIRVVDIAGDGTTIGSDGKRIYDAWVTWGSGGIDVEAVGAIHLLTDSNESQTVQTVSPGGDTWAHWGAGESELDILFQDTARGDGTAVDVTAEEYSGSELALIPYDVLSAWEVDTDTLAFEEGGDGTLVFHIDLGEYSGDGSDLLALLWDDTEWIEAGDIVDYDETTGLLTVEGVTDFSLLAVSTWIPGDANLDGEVSPADYTVWANNYGAGDSFSEGDFNGDNDVTPADYTIWANYYGASASGNPIPEPATMVLSALGGLNLLRRRKRV